MKPDDTQGSEEQQNPFDAVPAAEYLKAARAHLRNNKNKEAYSVVLQASAVYPDHAVILSYRGWLQALIDKKYKSGLATCRRAFVQFKTDDPDLAAKVYPILLLNLGKTFLLLDRRRDAVENFRRGLQYDRGNQELKKELKLLGQRKQPPISFLSRSNFLNLLIGKFFHIAPKNPKKTR